mgnify:CR=1 FL=1
MFISPSYNVEVGRKALPVNSEVTESKIVYHDGDSIRVLRGRITDTDDFFITLTRKDGTYRINKKYIIKIEEDKKTNTFFEGEEG